MGDIFVDHPVLVFWGVQALLDDRVRSIVVVGLFWIDIVRIRIGAIDLWDRNLIIDLDVMWLIGLVTGVKGVPDDSLGIQGEVLSQ